MRGPRQTIEELTASRWRGPGTDAERRAARMLAGRVRASGRRVTVEPHWVRPHWAAAHALHLALAVAASLASANAPVVAAAILGAVAISLAGDVTGRFFMLRRLTHARATQNVVSPPRAADKPALLIVTAAYDAPRSGVAYGWPGRLAARGQAAARGLAPGPFAWMELALLLLLGTAIARSAGTDAVWLDLVQFFPTIGLLLALALLIDIALSSPTPGANADGSAVAAALALCTALDAAPPRSLEVELVLAGAGAGPSLGMRAYVRARRRADPSRLVVLDIGPCGRGRPHWWTHDGPFVAPRLHPRLVELAARVAEAEPRIGARAHRGHSSGAAYVARQARWPAIRVGCLDRVGRAPGRGRQDDTTDRIDDASLRAALELCLGLVRAIDEELSAARAARP